MTDQPDEFPCHVSPCFCEAYSGQEAAAVWSGHNTQISMKAPRGRVESRPAYTVVVGGERSCTVRDFWLAPPQR